MFRVMFELFIIILTIVPAMHECLLWTATSKYYRDFVIFIDIVCFWNRFYVGFLPLIINNNILFLQNILKVIK